MDAMHAAAHIKRLATARERAGQPTASLQATLASLGTPARGPARQGAAAGGGMPDAAAAPARGHKFSAEAVIEGEDQFGSKAERARFRQLLELQLAGEVLFFLRQVPFHLPGRQKYVCDFMVFWRCGAVTVEDPKGAVTQEFANKMRMMESAYPHVCVEAIKGGVRRPATAAMQGVRQVPRVLSGDPSVQGWDAAHCGVTRSRGKGT